MPPEFDKARIGRHARKVRSFARLFEAAGEYSIAGDLFGKAAQLYQAADREPEADECAELADSCIVVAMDRVLRIAAQAGRELEPERSGAGVVLEVRH